MGREARRLDHHRCVRPALIQVKMARRFAHYGFIAGERESLSIVNNDGAMDPLALGAGFGRHSGRAGTHDDTTYKPFSPHSIGSLPL
jgi:hypothetical protein